MKFIDYVKIYVRSGNGGSGCVSFRREKYVPKGGPDGGDGGKGGDVVIKADKGLQTLLDHKYKKQYIAKNGQPGMGKKMHGKDGEDLIIRVPAGTVVKDAESGEIIEDLDVDGKEVVLVRGGKGGLGNSHFATSVRQSPRFAQHGKEGEEKNLVLELKLLADVGIIGLPNSGKSTLISVISAARPRVADYPFTTLVPNLGVVKYGEFKSFVVADIPGLIEGAYMGAGLGHQFLRHVERTSVLIHLVDISDMTEGDVIKNYKVILNELAKYADELMSRPQILVASKSDIANPEKLQVLRDYCGQNSIQLMEISAAAHQGIGELVTTVSEMLEDMRNDI
ncbi:GTPase ObgE [bacterium BMS3Abin07]|nr:GTPase ObgE [bacterium BMS3Abin07]GBE32051.1 GTPase ObgE [bacterium BMS3Bbin05]HDO23528.1 GTPase ObgE [Nitrospirota bacterium]